MYKKILLILIILISITACSLRVNPDKNSTELQDEPRNTEDSVDIGDIKAIFKKNAIAELDKLNKETNEVIQNKENQKNIDDFSKKFREELDKMDEEENAETLKKMTDDIKGHLEDDIETLKDQFNSTEEKTEFEEIMDNQEAIKKLNEFEDDFEEKEAIQKILDDIKNNLIEDIDDFDKKLQTQIMQIINNEIKKANKSTSKKNNFTCVEACKMYKECAGFGENVGEKGKNEAYDSCFQECQNWSQETLNCMKKITINSPIDCAPLTMCALKEY